MPPRPSRPRPTPSAPPQQHEVVDPRWILKAMAVVILAAFVCGYLSLCLLFYQGQWQLVLHPTRTSNPITTLAGLPAEPIRFDASESGIPRLSGALLPAAPGASRAAYTLLFLREGDGSLVQSPGDNRSLATLHGLGLNIFAFDYRGSGQSDPAHPNQRRMSEDAAAALRYLRDTRSIPEDHIVLYGTGLGASLAASLAAAHPAIPALILDSPGPRPIDTVLADPRVRFLPVHALFHDTFPLDALATLSTPKLLITYPAGGVFPAAADPKITLTLRPGDTAHLASGITRFLDQYLTHTP